MLNSYLDDAASRRQEKIPIKMVTKAQSVMMTPSAQGTHRDFPLAEKRR